MKTPDTPTATHAGFGITSDPELDGVLFTLVIDVVFFLLCFLLYQCGSSKNRFQAPSLSRQDSFEFQFAADSLLPESTHLDTRGWFGYDIIRIVTNKLPCVSWTYGNDLKDVPQEGLLYLRFQQYCVACLSVLSLLALTFVIPSYIAANPENLYTHGVTFWLFISSARNVPLGSDWLFAAAGFTMVTCTVIGVFFWQYLEDIEVVVSEGKASLTRDSSLFLETGETQAELKVEEHTIMLRHLASHIDSQMLTAHYNARFRRPDAVVIARVIYELKETIDLFRERNELRKQVGLLNQAVGARDRQKISALRAKLKGVTQELKLGTDANNEDHKISAVARHSTGNAFVTFLDSRHALQAAHKLTDADRISLASLHTGHMLLDDSQWKAQLAPGHKDVIWNNLCTPSSNFGKWMRYLFWNSVLFVSMIVLVTPITVVHYLAPFVQNFFELSHLEFIGAYFQVYVPTLAVVLVNSMILPVMIAYIADQEHHILKAKRQKSIMTKNVFFFFLNVIVLPTFALQSIRSFLLLLTEKRGFTEWQGLVGNAFLYSSGSFFIQYTIQAGLLGAGVQLLNLPQRLLRWYHLRHAQTSQDIKTARLQWDFDFGYYYSYRLTVFGLVLIYSVLVPLLLPCGLLYFVCNYWVDRHNLVNRVYAIQSASGPAYRGRIPLTAMRYVFMYLIVFMFGVSSYLAVQHSSVFSSLASLIFLALFVMVGAYLAHTCKTKMIATVVHNFEPAVFDPAEQPGGGTQHLRGQLLVAADVYRHPITRQQAEYRRLSQLGSGGKAALIHSVFHTDDSAEDEELRPLLGGR
jgi:hypothetical protein